MIVIDFGGQYNQLVARRVRECNVYCEIYSYKIGIDKIKEMNPKGIILTGGPNSCYEPDSPTYSKELFELGIPVLGLCYGAQLMQHVLGGKVEKAEVSEYGKTEVLIDKKDSKLFENVSEKTICWMSHTDYISQVAPGFEISAHTADCPVATAENADKSLYAIQFHPEVLHTVEGKTMLSNFVLGVCGCAGDWKMDAFVESTIKEIREKVGDGKVLLALSGGVDSSVAAGLLSRAIGKQLTCVFVDHGLLRKDEGDEVEGVFGENGQFDLNFIRVNAQQRYYDKLKGVTEPEAKRKIIGEEFIRIFEEEAKKIGAVDFLAQGTIYPDVVESGLGGESAVIKSHPNVSPYIRHELNKTSQPERQTEDYAVPYMWGTAGILFNKKFITPEEAGTWNILWTPKNRSKILMKDSYRDAYGTAIIYAHARELADSTVTVEQLMNDNSPQAIALAEKYLKEMKPNIAGWEADFGKEMMTKNKAWINFTWSGDAVWAIEEADAVGVELDYTVPREGSNIWYDGWVIPRYARNVKAASYFINYLCQPSVALRNMDAIGYVSAVATPEIMEAKTDTTLDVHSDLSYFFGPLSGADSLQIDPVQYPDRRVVERCAMIRDFGDRTELVLEMWSRVKGDNLNTGIVLLIFAVFGLLFIWLVYTKIRKYKQKRRHRLRRKRKRR